MDEIYLHWYIPDIVGLPRTYTSSIPVSDWCEDPRNRAAFMEKMRDGLIARIKKQHQQTIHPHEITCAVIDDPDLLWNFTDESTTP